MKQTQEMASKPARKERANRLSPEELGFLAKQLAAASDTVDAARLKERLTRGFYGAP